MGRVGHSIFPGIYFGRNDRWRHDLLYNGLLLHFHPKTVPQRTLEFTLTWGLGGMTVVLVGMLLLSGLSQKFAYQPVSDQIYEMVGLYIFSPLSSLRISKNECLFISK